MLLRHLTVTVAHFCVAIGYFVSTLGLTNFTTELGSAENLLLQIFTNLEEGKLFRLRLDRFAAL